MIRLLVVDDQAMFREGLVSLLARAEDLEVIAEASDGEAAIDRYRVHRPDVVLMDLRMPRTGGLEATRRLLEIDPDAKIIVLTTFDDDDELFEALRTGAAGYLLKASPSARVIEAIREVSSGGAVLEPRLTRRVLDRLARLAPAAESANRELAEPLSDRELEVLECLAEGMSNREIAEVVHLAEGTVKNYVSSILTKLDARDRTQAALEARRLGLLRS